MRLVARDGRPTTGRRSQIYARTRGEKNHARSRHCNNTHRGKHGLTIMVWSSTLAHHCRRPAKRKCAKTFRAHLCRMRTCAAPLFRNPISRAKRENHFLTTRFLIQKKQSHFDQYFLHFSQSAQMRSKPLFDHLLLKTAPARKQALC